MTSANTLPEINSVLWNQGDHKDIFNKWKRALELIILREKVNKKPNGWVLIYDQATRRAATSFPGLTTQAKRDQHEDGQTLLLCYLTTIWDGIYPDIIAAHTILQYHDPARRINDEPYPVGTMCLEAIDAASNPQDHKTIDNRQAKFRDEITTFQGMTNNSAQSLRAFQHNNASLSTCWQELATDPVFKAQEEGLIRIAKVAITTYMLKASEDARQMLWDKFGAQIETDATFIATHTLTQYLHCLSVYAQGAFDDLERAGLVQATTRAPQRKSSHHVAFNIQDKSPPYDNHVRPLWSFQPTFDH